MTEKEICERLRALAEGTTYFSVCKVAADEIERLAKELKEEKLLRLSERYPDVPFDQLAKYLK